MAYVSVSIQHFTDWRNYKSAGFQVRFNVSSAGVWNNDGQVVEVWHGSQRLLRREFAGRLKDHEFTTRVDATVGTYATNGQRHTFNVRIVTFDNAGDRDFSDEKSAIGYSYYTPRIASTSFTMIPLTETTARTDVRNLDVPQRERMSYQNWAQTAYNQFTAGQTSGTFTITGMDRNTRKDLARGMVEANADNGYLGNGEARRVLIPTYAKRSPFTTGTLIASRSGSSVIVNWGAWGRFGNIANYKQITMQLQIINTTNNSVIRTRNVNLRANGTDTVVDVPSVPIIVRLRATGQYFDNVRYNQVLDFNDLNFSDNNTYVKVNGTWRAGQQTFFKIGGRWRANNDNVKVKVNGEWR